MRNETGETKQTISVIIPVKNRHDALVRLLHSIANQERLPDEIFIIDDASNPKFEFDAMKFGILNGQTLPLKIIRFDTTRGPGAARNTGLQSSTADYSLFVDSDCVLPKDWTQSALKAFSRNPKIALLAGSAKIIEGNRFSGAVAMLGYPAGAGLGFQYMWKVAPSGQTDHFSGCCFGVRMSSYKAAGIAFDESLGKAACEDVLFSKQWIQSGKTIYFSNEFWVWHEACNSPIKFLRWHFQRGRGAYFYRKKGGSILEGLQKRLGTLRASLMASGPIEKPVVFLLFWTQVLSQAVGLVFEMIAANTYSRSDFTRNLSRVKDSIVPS